MFIYLGLLILTFSTSLQEPVRKAPREVPAAVIRAKGAGVPESLGAKEIRRYIYVRTGRLLPIIEERIAAQGNPIVIGSKNQELVRGLLTDADLRRSVESLTPEQYLLKTIRLGGRTVVLVVGGDPIGALYGAYRLAEHLEVRFYLHGDIVPDAKRALEIPRVDEVGKPLFSLRGIQPFHDFSEGPDWWNSDAYKAYLGQLPKMGMNFFGLHTYPQGAVGPEPATWIGTKDDIGQDSEVKFSYPSRHFTTLNQPSPDSKPAWGYAPTRTADYRYGAAAMFGHDDYGADYMQGRFPWTNMSVDQANTLFQQFGAMLRDTFSAARRLGIKTCIGTETPLAIPVEVKQRLRAAGKNPEDPGVVQEVYEGMFQRIKQTHPLDYFWLWTPENWTWRPVSDEQIKTTLADLEAAGRAAQKLSAPFQLATCGWVLGPPHDPSLFDRFLPRSWPMSCINRNVGFEPVEPGFAKIPGRPLWAIPWLEDDPAMIIPQLWVGRLRKDAADALRLGCSGLMGIHWRTRVLGPNVSALAKAAWHQSLWKTPQTDMPVPPLSGTPDEKRLKYQPERFARSDDFYSDWATIEFGRGAGRPIGALFARIDGRLPRPSTWVNGPGGIKPDARLWEEVRKEYAFVDEMAALRTKVWGAGNLERFDYWLETFLYLRALAQVNCTWARLNAVLSKVEKTGDSDEQKRLVSESAMPIRKELLAQVTEVHRHLLATVTTPGEMGTVANWQQHVLPMLLEPSEKQITKVLGHPLPPDAMPSGQYPGKPRIFVPVMRTGLWAGEPLKLEAVVLGTEPAEVTVYWRPLGTKDFKRVQMRHAARGVYRTTLASEAAKEDFEYYVQAMAGTARFLVPATAPEINQTVVVHPVER